MDRKLLELLAKLEDCENIAVIRDDEDTVLIQWHDGSRQIWDKLKSSLSPRK